MLRKSVPAVLAAILAFASLAVCQEKSSQADSITLAELRDHMFFLASDSLAGRTVGTEGYEIAARYVASQFRAAGLEPIAEGADGSKTFLQQVPLIRSVVASVDPWVLTTASGDQEIPIGDSIKGMSLSSSPQAPLQVVFAGFGISEPDHGWDDLEGLDLAGKAVIILAGQPSEGSEPVLPKDIDEKYLRGGTYAKLRELGKLKPAVVIVVSNDRLDRMWQRLIPRTEYPRYELAEGGEERDRQSGFNYFLVKSEVVEPFFAGQDYNPIPAARDSVQGFRRFELQGVQLRIGFEIDVKQVVSWNVVGMVRGTDPELANQYVTLGAHLDHVGPYGEQIYNGADDNASGSIGVIEVAEAIAMAPPRRPVVFAVYTGEEVGLLGSRYFVNRCPVPIGEVIVNINLDMIGRTAPAAESTRAHYVVGADKTCKELKETVIAVNERIVNWPLDFDGADGLFRNSDHYSFHEKGIPAFFFFSGIHPDLHKPTDDAEKIEYDKMQRIAQLVYELAMELGNADEPPCAVK